MNADYRDLRGRRSGDDRRQGPRREAERLEHYALQSLLAAVEVWCENPDDDNAQILMDRRQEWRKASMFAP